jgi:hypothetical protein
VPPAAATGAASTVTRPGWHKKGGFGDDAGARLTPGSSKNLVPPVALLSGYSRAAQGARLTLDNLWWRWVIDLGAPGPDRGQGGRYLILRPGYDGPLPEGGFFVAHARTTRIAILGRSFMENSDPKPAVELINKTTRIYPYEAGGIGTSIAVFLSG